MGLNGDLTLPVARTAFGPGTAAVAIEGRPISHSEVKIPGPGGEIVISVFRSTAGKGTPGPSPGVLYIHGGGLMAGNRYFGVNVALDFAEQFNAVVASVEYRLTPESPAPAALDDCWAALLWLSAHCSELGIDGEKLIVCGFSAGALLAAGLALMCRDKKGPALFAQLLLSPMLDDRIESVSSQQYVDEASWTRGSNVLAWEYARGNSTSKPVLDIYTVPGRATDLSRLPPTFIDVGGAELFRDEAVAYASLLWKGGVQAELHVWPGGYHGFELLAPTAELSVVSRATRLHWFERLFLH